MINSALLIALLALLALCVFIVGLALWRKKAPSVSETKSAQTAFFKQRRTELQAELARGLISEQEHATLQLELERQLLADVSEAEKFNGGHKTFLNVVLIVMLPVAASALYWQYGAWNDMQIAKLQTEYLQSFSKPETQRDPTLLPALIASVEHGVAQNPESAQHQVLAARLYMEAGDYPAAAKAYAAALLENQESAELLALWAQADYLARDRKLSTASRQALKKALTIDPNNTTALGLLGLDAFIAGRMLETIDIWQKLIAVLPQGSPQAEMIRDGLGRAMQVAKEQGLYKGETTSSVAAKVADSSVPVTVQFSSDLGEIPEGRLFVFALGDDGMPMPLAVKSMASNSLPITVSLADADAMIPSRKISAFKTITLVARITKNGSVRAESGDVEGRTAPITLAEAQQGVTLLIDARIP